LSAGPDPFAQLPPDAADLARRWSEAAWSPAVDAALRALHDEMAAATDALGPRCDTSGRCCNFDAWGHRLYATGLETAWCLRGLGTVPGRDAVLAAWGRGDCPFLEGRRCGAHAWRPIGCRAYFCDPRAAGWQEALSERILARLRDVHEAHGVPYRYGEWRTMLAHFAA